MEERWTNWEEDIVVSMVMTLNFVMFMEQVRCIWYEESEE